MGDNRRTTKGRIRSTLKRLWIQSRERAIAIKRDNYSCQSCGVKQSKAKGREQKIEVHHKAGINNWDEVIKTIQDNLLCDPDNLQSLCPECHAKETYGDND